MADEAAKGEMGEGGRKTRYMEDGSQCVCLKSY